MFEYIKGIVTQIKSVYIVVENNGIGYLVYVSNPYSFTENKEYKVYLYQKVAEDENSLYGFKTKEDKDMFLRLISVKGLGPKTALSLFSVGSLDTLVEAI